MQILLRTLRSCHFYKHLVLQNPPPSLSPPPSPSPLLRCLDSGVLSYTYTFIPRCFSSSAASSQSDFDVLDERIEAESTHGQEKTNESNALESTVASPNTSKTTEQQQHRSVKKKKRAKGKPLGTSALQEIQELKEKIQILEKEMRVLKPNVAKKDGVEAYQPKSQGLYSIFKTPPPPPPPPIFKTPPPPPPPPIFKTPPPPSKKKTTPRREKKSTDMVESRSSGKALKELSPEILSFVNHLHEEGYLKEANFLKDRELDLDGFSNHYFHGFVKSAAERFGHSHQEIAKYLSGSDLKRVALFGCPTIERKTVFPAKGLRSFFNIEEDIVCRACKLKSSCQFMNHKVRKVENVELMGTLRLLTSYALEDVPQPLEVSDDMKLSINKLLKEVVNLSK